ncbi:ABC transporter ATP-binding protein [Natronobeatus ordinarius]|uniref:ABC transporter ATP-binding protein n=1 Tax=Natronobeatus ordinarius TaxID=2963433 RepID=UPI0020CEC753|nr:oligopeptide/dipeptide ABC transporter ATP-binding protein [Natronobeatus ordinarius]
MADEPILTVDGLTKYYESEGSFVDTLLGRSQQVRAVEDVDLELYQGETLGIVGESGCGKTTLGRALLRLVEPTAGSITYRNEQQDGSVQEIELTDLSSSALRDLRTDLQYIFQNPFSSLNPRLTVGDIIGEPLDIHDIAEGEARTDRIYDLLETVGLNPSHAHRYPHEFSGGQRQRIGIARALAVDPEVIVCDEPVSALDVSVQAQILNLLEDLQTEFGLSYIFIAHDLSVVEHISDRVAVMYLGEIAEVGRTEKLFATPRHPYTEALLSVIPEPDPAWVGNKILLEGQVPSPIDPPDGCRFHTRCHRVIPPDGMDLEQSTWRSILDLKLRAREATSIAELVSLGPEGELRLGLDDEDIGTVDDAVRSAFGIPSRLPAPDAEAQLSDAIETLHEAGPTAAAETLDDGFVSPCETTNPELFAVDGTQEVACLLYDEPYRSSELEAPDDDRSEAAADD